MPSKTETAKYVKIFESLQKAIRDGRYPRDVALPSEEALPDAVVCESDYVAAVFRNTLAKFGLAVPQDVLLAGFDDVRCAMTATPALTTAHQPCADIARIAYNTLRERIGDSDLPPRRILLPAPLVVRDSSRKFTGTKTNALRP